MKYLTLLKVFTFSALFLAIFPTFTMKKTTGKMDTFRWDASKIKGLMGTCHKLASGTHAISQKEVRELRAFYDEEIEEERINVTFYSKSGTTTIYSRSLLQDLYAKIGISPDLLFLKKLKRVFPRAKLPNFEK